MSKLVEIFSQESLKLPFVYQDNGDDIIKLLEQKLLAYINTLGGREYYKVEVTKENHEKVANCITETIRTITFWYEGQIEKAKQNFDTFLLDPLLSLPQKTIKQGTVFYRVRTTSEHKILGRKELFHIPFELRHKIATQRFSIPGFPCLYLGNSIYICWEELNRPDFHDIQVAKLVNKEDITLYNLSYEQYDYERLKNQTLSQEDIVYLLMCYPIIAACSIKVPQKRQFEPFKPEYVIPQIIMQSIMSRMKSSKKPETIGFVYSSTRMYNSKSQSQGSFENYVFPTTSSVKPEGYCTHLTHLFDMTSVTAGWPLDFIKIDDCLTCDFKVEKLDLDGLLVNYEDTRFALLEKLLSNQTAIPILDNFNKG